MYPTFVQALPKANAHDTGAFTAASALSPRQGLLKRFDITGARWGLEGAEAILKLRALIATGDFEDYWRFHLRREHERIHHARYRDSHVLAA